MGCNQVKHASYEEVLESDLRSVSYGDGVDKKEAVIIGDNYLYKNATLLHTGHHPPSIGKIVDTDKFWEGRITIGTAIGMMPHPFLAPICIKKTDGTVTWKDEGITTSELKERSMEHEQSNKALQAAACSGA